MSHKQTQKPLGKQSLPNNVLFVARVISLFESQVDKLVSTNLFVGLLRRGIALGDDPSDGR